MIDACVNTAVKKLAQENARYHSFLIEVVIQWMEEKLNLRLSRGILHVVRTVIKQIIRF